MLPILNADMKDEDVSGPIFLWGGNSQTLPMYVNQSGQSYHQFLTVCSGYPDSSTKIFALVPGQQE